MTDNTPTAAPLQMADVQWSENVVVSMELTGAPGIPAPCGHLLQPIAFMLAFRRGSIPELTLDWDLEDWQMYVVHPDEGGLGELELTLSSKHFGEVGTGSIPVPEGMRGMAEMLGIPLPQEDLQEDLLGPVPEWVHTAIKSYEPFQALKGAPVRLDATYHG